MRTYHTLYRFRYAPDLGAWEKMILFPALVSGTEADYTLTDGLDRNASVTIRIMSDEKPDVVPGDVICTEDGVAPSSHHLTVVSVTDNRFGTKHVRHIKLVCR